MHEISMWLHACSCCPSNFIKIEEPDRPKIVGYRWRLRLLQTCGLRLLGLNLFSSTKYSFLGVHSYEFHGLLLKFILLYGLGILLHLNLILYIQLNSTPFIVQVTIPLCFISTRNNSFIIYDMTHLFEKRHKYEHCT